jgi:hypothetical protein
LKVSEGLLVPVLNVKITVGGLPFSATANTDKVYDFGGDYFTVAGTVKAYVKNAVHAVIGTFTIDLIGDTHLTTDKLTTKTGAVARATASDHNFDFGPGDPQFPEANAFSHVAAIYSWFADLGYKWTTSALTIYVNQDIPTPSGASKNNALYVPTGYQPPSGPASTGPAIAVGDGDGTILRDLPTDSDVVTHEFGHHVIFHKLKSTGLSEAQDGSIDSPNHSAVLHEGLADFFTFAYTGDACLAESICPPGTTACVVMEMDHQCLRSGTNTMKYDTDQYWSLGKAAHLKGQIISGTMWDIRNRPNVDHDEFTKLAFGSIEYLLSSSSYADWIVALMSADRDLFDGKYGCDITAAAIARGFAAEVAAKIPDCKLFNAPDPVEPAPSPDSTPSDNGSDSQGEPNAIETEKASAESPSVPEPSQSKDKNNKIEKMFCGSIATPPGDPGPGVLALLILVLVPVVSAPKRRPAEVLAKRLRK